ncbi:MAG: FHA domain-containing protein [Myxococcota bacterium]
MPKLKFKSSSGKTLEVEINADLDEITIGRNPGNIIRIANQSISRNHARIKFDGVRCTIYDLNSSNGVFVNGKRVRSQILYNGDRLRCGEFPLDFEDPSEAAQPPPLSAQEMAEDTTPPPPGIGRTESGSVPSVAEIERLRTALAEATEAQHKAEQELNDYRDNNPTLEEFQALVAERAELEQRLAQIGSDAQEEGGESPTVAELEALRKERDQLQEQHDQLQEQHDQLQEQHNQLQAEATAQDDAAEPSAHTASEAITELQAEIDELQAKLDAAPNTETLDALNQERDQLQEQRDQLQEQHDQLQEQRDQLQEQHAQLQERLQAEATSEVVSLEQELASLKTEVSAVQAERDMVQSEHQTAVLEREQLQETLAERDARVTELETKLEQLQTLGEDAHAHVEALRTERDQFKDQLQQLELLTQGKGVTVDAFEALLAERDNLLEAQRNGAMATLPEHEQLAQLQAERDRYKDELDQIRANALDVGAVGFEEHNHLNMQMEALRAKHASLETALSDVQARAEVLEVERDQLRREVTHARNSTTAELTEHREAMERAYNDLAQSQQDNQALEKARQALQSSLDEANAQLDASLQNDAAPNSEHTQMLQARIAELEAQQTQVADTTDVDLLREQLNTTQEALHNAEMEHDALLAKVRGLESALTSRNVEMEQIMRDSNGLQRARDHHHEVPTNPTTQAAEQKTASTHTSIPSTQRQAYTALTEGLSQRIRIEPTALQDHVEHNGSGFATSPVVYNQIAAALNFGKHVALISSEVEGMGDLARDLGMYAHEQGMSLGSLCTTIGPDWTANDTLGQSTDAFGFVPGIFLESIRTGQWLIVHGLEDAEPTALFGALTPALSGYPVALPFLVGSERLMVHPPASNDPTQWLPEEARHGTTWVIHPNWRMVITLPSMHAARAMSSELRRRFVFIPLPSRVKSESYTRNLPQWLKQAEITQLDQDHGLQALLEQLLEPSGALVERGAITPGQVRELLGYIRERRRIDAQLKLTDALCEALTLFVIPEIDDTQPEIPAAVRAQLAATLPDSGARAMLMAQLPDFG